MSIAVIGAGYVGLTTAVAFASTGHQVVGIDIDQQRVDLLNSGVSPIVEEGVSTYLRAGLSTGHLTFDSDISAVADAEFIFLCLPTPTTPSGHPDLSFVESACLAIRDVASPGAVAITKSTVPVGTHRTVSRWLDRPDLAVVSNPEFLREGTALADFLDPDRVVVGAIDRRAAERVADLYRGFTDSIVMVGPTEAELIKYAANAFLATRLSFVNEIARISAAFRADPTAVLAGLGADHRVGPHFLQPGPGWGGSCFPKDTIALQRLAIDAAIDVPVISGAIESNDRQIDHTIATILSIVPSCGVARIAVWGLTFKAGTDDTRCSPAMSITARLASAGHSITTFDPATEITPPGTTSAPDMFEATRGAHLLVVLTEWDEFAKADLNKVASLMSGSRIYDARMVLDRSGVETAGLEYFSLARQPALAFSP